MMTIDALGKDGASILPDLEGASPTGGFVTTGSKPCTELRCGDVLRGGRAWTVIAGLSHDAMIGAVTVAVIDYYGTVTRETFWAGESVECRTDTRIDPATLYKLAGTIERARIEVTYPEAPDTPALARWESSAA